MKLSTVLTIGKGLTIKREKGDDDIERRIAHLKFSDLLLKREEFDELCQQNAGWTQGAFFDDLGAPCGLFTLTVERREWTVTGAINLPNGEKWKFGDLTLSDVAAAFNPNAVMVSGTLSWEVAGDEAGSIDPLLGCVCGASWVVQSGGQGDFLKGKAA